MQANASMDCDGNVAVHAVNDAPLAFHGASGTASAWIVAMDLAPGAAQDFGAHFGAKTMSLSGAIQGTLSDGTSVRTVWSATRPAECAAPTTTAPKPIDTTPKPVPTTEPNQTVIYCAVPGANPPMQVPCDDPRATTPYVPPTPPTTAPAAPAVEDTAPVATEAPAPTQARTGPPKHHAVVAQQPASLPETGIGMTVGIGGTATLAIGVILLAVSRRRHPVH
jgi:hypothetical protein